MSVVRGSFYISKRKLEIDSVISANINHIPSQFTIEK